MKTVINITDIQNGKQNGNAALFTFQISCISLFRFLLFNDEYRVLIPADIVL